MLDHLRMRTSVVLILATAAACQPSRSTPSAAPARAAETRPTPSAQPAVLAPVVPDVTLPPPQAPVVNRVIVRSTNCTDDAAMRALGAALVDGGAPVACVLPDGGAAFTIPPDTSVRRRGALLVAMALIRQLATMSAAQRAREIDEMDREARTDHDHWTTPGLIFRAPERQLGRMTRIEGEARDVREHDGETELTINTDLLGQERFAVRFPGIADDRVVTGARVRAYGFYVEATTVTDPLRSVMVPVVYAGALVAVADPGHLPALP